jgi:uncharacterized protein (TIGR02118 family)
MASVLALYNRPQDPAAFDDYYRSTHTPIARKIPGLRALRISHGAINAAAGTSPYYLVAELMFDSMAAIQAGLASPEGQATAADLQNFADGGVTLLMYETEDA